MYVPGERKVNLYFCPDDKNPDEKVLSDEDTVCDDESLFIHKTVEPTIIFNDSFPNLKLAGSEVYIEGLQFASKRVATAELMQIDASDIPFSDEFDVVGIFDVLEHIEQDQSILDQLYKTVSPGGGLIITVPQHQFLWSYQDVAASHVRRYSSFELEHKVKESGFEIITMTSFVSLLLPLMMAMRFAIRGHQIDFDPQGELKINSTLNSLLAFYHFCFKLFCFV